MPGTGRTRRRVIEAVLAVTVGLGTWLVMTPAAEASWSPTTGLEFVQPNEWSQDGAPLVKLSVTLWQ